MPRSNNGETDGRSVAFNPNLNIILKPGVRLAPKWKSKSDNSP